MVNSIVIDKVIFDPDNTYQVLLGWPILVYLTQRYTTFKSLLDFDKEIF